MNWVQISQNFRKSFEAVAAPRHLTNIAGETSYLSQTTKKQRLSQDEQQNRNI